MINKKKERKRKTGFYTDDDLTVGSSCADLWKNLDGHRRCGWHWEGGVAAKIIRERCRQEARSTDSHKGSCGTISVFFKKKTSRFQTSWKVTYSDVRDLKPWNASPAMELIWLLLKSLDGKKKHTHAHLNKFRVKEKRKEENLHPLEFPVRWESFGWDLGDLILFQTAF